MRLLLVKRAKKRPKRKKVVRVKREAKIKLMMNQRTSQKLVLAK